MNKLKTAIILAALASAAPAFAKKKPTTAPTTAPADTDVVETDQQRDQAYTDSLEKRTDKILAALHLADPAQSARVHDILIAHYRALHDWQSTYQPAGEHFSKADKDPAAQAALAKIHNQFNSDLSSVLTPDQVEAVKDQLTVNKVHVTYDAYVQIVPNLTDDDKTHILDYLKQAREQAIDAGSMQDKSAIFKVYKGKINIYLTAHGHNVSQAYKDWGAAQKAKAAAAATQPS